MVLLCLLCVQDIADLPEGASTPALGLSNKAVFQGTNPLKSLATGEFALCWSQESGEGVVNLYCGV